MENIPYFCTQSWEDESEGSNDSIVKHKPLWSPYSSKHQKGKKKKAVKKKGDLYRTYGTRVIPVWVDLYKPAAWYIQYTVQAKLIC